MNYEINLTVTVTEEFLSDVMITAFDGQYGGCWYWAEPAHNDWLKVTKEDRGPCPLCATSGVGVCDSGPHTSDRWQSVEAQTSDEPEAKPFTVTHRTLLDGIRTIVSKDLVNNEIRDAIMRGVMDNDAGEIDATAADCIVQVGALGGVVFG